MMGVCSKDFVKSSYILPFETLAVNGKIRCDMKEPGHHDGWGMVSYFREGFPEYLEREPHSVTLDSKNFKNSAQVIEEQKSKVALIHFRKISVGEPLISNTHPFLCKKWAFCHNGTIYESEKIILKHLIHKAYYSKKESFLQSGSEFFNATKNATGRWRIRYFLTCLFSPLFNT